MNMKIIDFVIAIVCGVIGGFLAEFTLKRSKSTEK